MSDIHGFYLELMRDDAIADAFVEVVDFDKVENFLFASDDMKEMMLWLDELRVSVCLCSTGAYSG